MTLNPPEKPHHHGNLREALIGAGIEILKEGGLPALTLRACAARAGVSHAAPAHHFDGLPGLVTAIAARGYGVFTDTMIEEREKECQAPYARLLAICHGYLRFARENQALFTLMFNTYFELTNDPDLVTNSKAAYGILADECASFEPLEVGAAGTEVMVWSLVHGFACLQLSGRLGPPDAPARTLRFEDILPKLTLRCSAP